jgi:hypothetical protein
VEKRRERNCRKHALKYRFITSSLPLL